MELGRVGKEGGWGGIRMDPTRVENDHSVRTSGFFRGLGYEYRRDAVCGAQPLEQFGYLLPFAGIE